MENTPFDPNNPAPKMPKRQSTVPLEPRIPREQLEEQEKYMPRPSFPEPTVANARPDAPAVNPYTAPVPPAQQAPANAMAGRRQAPRATINFPAMPGPTASQGSPAPQTPAPASQTAPQTPRPMQEPDPRQMAEPTPRQMAEPTPRPQTPYNQPQRPAPQQPQRPVPQQPQRPVVQEPQRSVVQEPQRSAGPQSARTVAAPQGYAAATPPPAAPGAPGAGYRQGYPRPDEPKKSKSPLMLIIGIVVAALLLAGGGCWWYFSSRDNSKDLARDADSERVDKTDHEDDATSPERSGESSAASDAEAPGVSEGTESTSLFNRPLTYTGTVTPGGAAKLNVVYFQNGRIEGTLDYASGKSMPVFGSYTWADNGHKMNINFTVSSPSQQNYSESWSGHSSFIKDDLAHTLTFSRINTSEGQSMSANFALDK